MRTRKIAILLLIIMCSFLLYAKENPKDSGKENQAPNKTWKIIVNNNHPADENFEMIGRVLEKYAITVNTKENNTMKVSIKNNFREKIVTYLLTLSVKDNAIDISGKYSTNISVGPVYDEKSEKSFSMISNRGMKGSVKRETFYKMQSFALLLGNNLEYVAE